MGFIAASCGGGGGNIKKVQNGVFSSYDNTITVGKALENNSTLKGCKWEALEMDGRDYVTYTVRLTGEQVQAILLKSFSSNSFYANKPNYGTAMEFYENALTLWFNNVRNATVLARLTSMSAEEVSQERDIFKVKLDAYEDARRQRSPNRFDFIDFSGVIDSYAPNSWNLGKMNDNFIDPYLLTIKGQVNNSGGTVVSSDSLDDWIYKVVTYRITQADGDSTFSKLGIIDDDFDTSRDAPFESGSDGRRNLDRFRDSNFRDNTELFDALVRTRIKFYDWWIKPLPQPEYEKAVAEYEEMRNKDLEPLLTIDGYEVVLSFVMNQDDTFNTNMMEGYTEVTLNSLDNLKVRYNAGNSDSVQIILSCIYRGFTPDFF
jgi:hypothetical protein